jgi:hypothetical protein
MVHTALRFFGFQDLGAKLMAQVIFEGLKSTQSFLKTPLSHNLSTRKP